MYLNLCDNFSDKEFCYTMTSTAIFMTSTATHHQEDWVVSPSVGPLMHTVSVGTVAIMCVHVCVIWALCVR